MTRGSRSHQRRYPKLLSSPFPTSNIMLLPLLLVIVVIIATTAKASSSAATSTYGTDVSYPMHYPSDVMTDPQRKQFYQDHMEGCFQHYSEESCLEVENDRIAMNLRQPQSMKNYTSRGYMKMKAPPKVWKLIQEFWNTNRNERTPEQWAKGSIYVNHWASQVDMVAVDNTTLIGGGNILKTAIWQAARSTLSEWTQQHLADCSLWGIRVYHDGAILAPHVDRLPLVASAIINVDQDVDEPWPLEVIGHDGIAHNVTMEPGDLVLYESHSIIHGRPYPLKGRFMANIFVHFEPMAPLSDYNSQQGDSKPPPPTVMDGELPPYILPNSPEIPNWLERNPGGWHAVQTQELTLGTTEAHQAVQKHSIQDLKYILNIHPYYVNTPDELGWTPLHEAARTGSLEFVQTLVEMGGEYTNVNAVTNGGESVLLLAVHYLETSPLAENEEWKTKPLEHPMVQYLMNLGAKLERDGIRWDPITGERLSSPSQEEL